MNLALNSAAHLFLVPPGLLILLLAAGLLSMRRHPALGRVLAWTGTALLLLLSLPPVARSLTRLAGDYPPLPPDSAAQAQAIVVLAAEARPAPEYGGEGYSVSDLSLERLRYGARLARRTGLPVLLSGGRAFGASPVSLAELMQSVLHEDFGVDARWLETKSRNTRENAQGSAPLLAAAGAGTVLLVTDENHMRRAIAEFDAAGIRALPAPVRIPAAPPGWLWTSLRPGLSALRDSSLAIYELAGQAEQWLVPPPRRAAP